MVQCALDYEQAYMYKACVPVGLLFFLQPSVYRIYSANFLIELSRKRNRKNLNNKLYVGVLVSTSKQSLLKKLPHPFCAIWTVVAKHKEVNWQLIDAMLCLLSNSQILLLTVYLHNYVQGRSQNMNTALYILINDCEAI